MTGTTYKESVDFIKELFEKQIRSDNPFETLVISQTEEDKIWQEVDAILIKAKMIINNI